MKKFITLFIASLAVMAAVFSPLALAPVTYAASPEESICIGSGGTWKAGACTKPGNTRTVMGTIRAITNVLVFLVGAVAVIMIVIGGFKYTTSQGDQSAITSAKNTILYAIIGIVVAFLAYAAVNWFIRAL